MLLYFIPIAFPLNCSFPFLRKLILIIPSLKTASDILLAKLIEKPFDQSTFIEFAEVFVKLSIKLAAFFGTPYLDIKSSEVILSPILADFNTLRMLMVEENELA